ncbi:MAG TPA: dihydrodipicolinate synthase family protein [Thermoanaerobaculia bacterium]|nr:dihydrodipicolinate synthase family protein [Thermoanaerobaculia bacterium]
MRWRGVFPAITTPFGPDLAIDLPLLRRQVGWLIDQGCEGIVPLGSLGEGATLSFDEKGAVLAACREAADGRVPVVAGVAALSTAEASALARAAAASGCQGLMVLPPYVYVGDGRETAAHFQAVIGATPLPCMLYNNPIAYRTDVSPGELAQLCAELPNLEAVKESSGDVRRVTAIRALLGERIAVFMGVDDLILEGVQAGAVGWIAGLVDALPAESVRLFDLAVAGRVEEARRLYDWFLPLLRLDTVPKFVQLIKLAQAEVGMGTPTVRPPRLQLAGPELEAAQTLIRDCLRRRPPL